MIHRAFCRRWPDNLLHDIGRAGLVGGASLGIRPFLLRLAIASVLAVTPGAILAETDGPLSVCETDQGVPDPVAAKLDTMLRLVVDPESEAAGSLGYAPGAELFVRSKDWTYHRAVGTADLATKAALDCGRPFQIGSNTKMMTATVLMQMVEAGQLSLDDPLSMHLPEIAAVLPFGDKITIRQLANHTSGTFSYTDNAPNGAVGIMEGAISDQSLLEKGYTPEELIAFVIDQGEPNFEPGAEGKWAYSNTGFVLIGMILEKISGQALEDLFRDRIFVPLGMQNTFLWNEIPEPDFRLPSSYFRAPFEHEMTRWNMSQGWAAGAVISTSADMDLFMRGLLSGSLFKDPATLNMMKDPVPTDGTFLAYGIGLGEKVGGFWGHGGQTLGFESDVGVFVDQDISVAVWTNSANNLAGLGATFIFGALGEAGALKEREPTGDAAQTLAGTRWTWVSTVDGGSQTRKIDMPERYAVAFLDGGDLALQADCNRVLGSYVAKEDLLSLTLGPSTKAMCPADTLDDRFLQELAATTGFKRNGDTLVLLQGQDGPAMTFARIAD